MIVISVKSTIEFTILFKTMINVIRLLLIVKRIQIYTILNVINVKHLTGCSKQTVLINVSQLFKIV